MSKVGVTGCRTFGQSGTAGRRQAPASFLAPTCSCRSASTTGQRRPSRTCAPHERVLRGGLGAQGGAAPVSAIVLDAEGQGHDASLRAQPLLWCCHARSSYVDTKFKSTVHMPAAEYRFSFWCTTLLWYNLCLLVPYWGAADDAIWFTDDIQH
jgi:hypothetical protein